MPTISNKVSAKAKREAVVKVFGTNQVDPEDIALTNFFFARLHCATVRINRKLELQYVIELQDLEQVIWKTLDQIRDRDGMKIFKEAAEELIRSVEVSIENNGRGRRARRPDNRSAAH
jgi:hypothetical protein